MIPRPDQDLQRDLFASSAARLRRRLRHRRQAAVTLASLAALASLATILLPEAPPAEFVSSAPPARSPEAPTRQPKRDVASPDFSRLATDDELLAALAEQGPMLITHPDGRKQLILTRPR